MKHSEIVTLSIRDLIPHPRNPRKISQEDLNRLCDSIRQNGYWQHRPMAVEPVPGQPGKYYILDGNQRKKALGRLKRYEAPCMIYTELTDEVARRGTGFDERSAGTLRVSESNAKRV